MASLTLSLIEIIVLMMGAIVLGITIHFFLVSRRSLQNGPLQTAKVNKTLEEWKLRYFNDVEIRDKELTDLRKRVAEAEENCNIYQIEAEEMRLINKELQGEMETQKKVVHSHNGNDSPDGKPRYIEQLQEAQSSLMAHNEKINQLLGQIDIVKETEEKHEEIFNANEVLRREIDDLSHKLSQKDIEINSIRKKDLLTKEMTSMLDSAYGEFNALQDKIHKLEAQVNSSKKVSMEYEDLKESYYKVTRDFEEQKARYESVFTENQQLKADISDTDQKFREANFHRQQLQKRVAYLEDINNDMQSVTEANKRLEGQLKRIGELESLLNVNNGSKD